MPDPFKNLDIARRIKDSGDKSNLYAKKHLKATSDAYEDDNYEKEQIEQYQEYLRKKEEAAFEADRLAKEQEEIIRVEEAKQAQIQRDEEIAVEREKAKTAFTDVEAFKLKTEQESGTAFVDFTVARRKEKLLKDYYDYGANKTNSDLDKENTALDYTENPGTAILNEFKNIGTTINAALTPRGNFLFGIKGNDERYTPEKLAEVAEAKRYLADFYKKPLNQIEKTLSEATPLLEKEYTKKYGGNSILELTPGPLLRAGTYLAEGMGMISEQEEKDIDAKNAYSQSTPWLKKMGILMSNPDYLIDGMNGKDPNKALSAEEQQKLIEANEQLAMAETIANNNKMLNKVQLHQKHNEAGESLEGFFDGALGVGEDIDNGIKSQRYNKFKNDFFGYGTSVSDLRTLDLMQRDAAAKEGTGPLLSPMDKVWLQSVAMSNMVDNMGLNQENFFVKAGDTAMVSLQLGAQMIGAQMGLKAVTTSGKETLKKAIFNQVSKTFARKLYENVAKEAGEEVVEAGVKEAGKEILEEGIKAGVQYNGKRVAPEVIAQGIKDRAAKGLAEKTAKETIENSGEKLIKGTANKLNAGIYNNAIAEKGSEGIVATANTLAMPFLLPHTYSMFAEKMTAPIALVKDLNGNEVILTSKKQREAYAKKLNDYESVQLEKLKRLSLDKEGNRKEIDAIQNDLFNKRSELAKIVDPESGKIKEDVKFIDAAFHGYTESLKEVFSELVVGKAAGALAKKVDSSILSGKVSKFAKEVAEAKDNVLNKISSKISDNTNSFFGKGKGFVEGAKKVKNTIIGHIDKHAFRNSGFDDVFQSMPEEIAEELFVQAVPTYNAEKGGYFMSDYMKQLEEFRNPEFYLLTAISTGVMSGSMSSLKGTGGLLSSMSKDYRDSVTANINAEDAPKVKKEAATKVLEDFYVKVNNSVNDEEAAKSIAYGTGRTLKDPLAMEAYISRLRLEGHDDAANHIEAQTLNSMLIHSLNNNMLDEYKAGLESIVKNKNTNPDLRENAILMLKETIPIVEQIRQEHGDKINFKDILNYNLGTNVKKNSRKALVKSEVKLLRELEDKIKEAKDNNLLPKDYYHGTKKEYVNNETEIELAQVTEFHEDNAELFSLIKGHKTLKPMITESIMENNKNYAYHTDPRNQPVIKKKYLTKELLENQDLSSQDLKAIKKELNDLGVKEFDEQIDERTSKRKVEETIRKDVPNNKTKEERKNEIEENEVKSEEENIPEVKTELTTEETEYDEDFINNEGDIPKAKLQTKTPNNAAKPIVTPVATKEEIPDEVKKEIKELEYSIGQIEQILQDKIDNFKNNGASLEEATKIANKEFDEIKNGTERTALNKLKNKLNALKELYENDNPTSEANTPQNDVQEEFNFDVQEDYGDYESQVYESARNYIHIAESGINYIDNDTTIDEKTKEKYKNIVDAFIKSLKKLKEIRLKELEQELKSAKNNIEKAAIKTKIKNQIKKIEKEITFKDIVIFFIEQNKRANGIGKEGLINEKELFDKFEIFVQIYQIATEQEVTEANNIFNLVIEKKDAVLNAKKAFLNLEDTINDRIEAELGETNEDKSNRNTKTLIDLKEDKTPFGKPEPIEPAIIIDISDKSLNGYQKAEIIFNALKEISPDAEIGVSGSDNMFRMVTKNEDGTEITLTTYEMVEGEIEGELVEREVNSSTVSLTENALGKSASNTILEKDVIGNYLTGVIRTNPKISKEEKPAQEKQEKQIQQKIKEEKALDNLTLTTNATPKLGYVGIPYQVVTYTEIGIDKNTGQKTIVEKTKKVYKALALNDNKEININLVLDPDKVKKGTELEVKIPDNVESKMVSWNEIGKEPIGMTFGEWLDKKKVPVNERNENFEVYANKVPLMSSIKEGNVGLLHDTEWYSIKNVGGDTPGEQSALITQGVLETQTLRNGIIERLKAGKKAEIIVLERKFGSILNMTQLLEHNNKSAEERKDIAVPLSEATDNTHLFVATTNNKEGLSQGDQKVGDLSKEYNFVGEKQTIVKGRLYEARHIQDNDYILLEVLTNTDPKGINDTAYNSVKYAVIASVYLSINNADLKAALTDKYGIDEDIANKIKEDIEYYLGIDITEKDKIGDGLGKYISLFTNVDKETSDGQNPPGKKEKLESKSFNKNGDKLLYPAGRTYIGTSNSSISFSVKGEKKDIFINLKTGIKNEITQEQIDGILKGLATYFEWDNGAFRKATFDVDKAQIGKLDGDVPSKNNLVTISEAGIATPSNYDNYVKDNVKSTIKSFKIPDGKGEFKTIADVQPMIYIGLKDEPVTQTQIQETIVDEKKLPKKELTEPRKKGEPVSEGFKATETMKKKGKIKKNQVLKSQKELKKRNDAIKTRFKKEQPAAIGIEATVNAVVNTALTENPNIDINYFLKEFLNNPNIDIIEGFKSVFADILPISSLSVTFKNKTKQEIVSLIRNAIKVFKENDTFDENLLDPNYTPTNYSKNDEFDGSYSEEQEQIYDVETEETPKAIPKTKKELYKEKLEQALGFLPEELAEKIFKNGIITYAIDNLNEEDLTNEGLENFAQSARNFTELEAKNLSNGNSKTKVSSLTLEEQNAISNSLFNLIATVLNKKGKLSKEKINTAIAKSVDTYLAPQLEEFKQLLKEIQEFTSKNTEVAPRVKIIADIFDKRVKKLEVVLTEKEKLTGENSKLRKKFSKFINEKIDIQSIEDLSENNEDEITSTDQDADSKNFAKASAEVNIKTSFSQKLKLLFSGVKKQYPNIHDNGVSDLKNIAGLPEYYSADLIMSRLLDITTAKNYTIDELLKELKKRGEIDIMFAQIYDIINAADEQTKTELIFRTTVRKLDMFMLFSFTDKDGNTKNIFKNLSNSYFDQLEEEWTQVFKTSSMFVPDKDKYKYDINAVEAGIAQLTQLINAFNRFKGNPDKTDAEEKIIIAQAKKALLTFGISVNDNSIRAYFEPKYAAFDAKQGVFGLLSTHLNSVLLSFNEKENKDGVVFESNNDKTNPFKFIRKQLRNLVELEVYYVGGQVDKSIRCGDKTLQGVIKNTMAYQTLEDLKDPESEYSKNLKKIPYSKDNFVLGIIAKDKKFAKHFALGFVPLTAMKITTKANEELETKDFENTSGNINEISESDFSIKQVASFHNKLRNVESSTLSNGFTTRMSNMYSHSIADKGQALQFTTAVLNLKSSNFEDKGENVEVKDKVLNFMLEQMFIPEFNRIVSIHGNTVLSKNGTNIKNYDNAAAYFLSLPIFNEITLKGIPIAKMLESIDSSTPNGKAYIEKLLKEEAMPQAKELLKELLNAKLKEKVDENDANSEWIKFGILKNNFLKSKEETEKELKNEAKSIENIKNSKMSDEGKEAAINKIVKLREAKEKNKKVGYTLSKLDSRYVKAFKSDNDNNLITAKKLALDFIINELLHKNNLHQLFAGDLALYAGDTSKFKSKDSEGNEIFDHIEFTQAIGEAFNKRVSMEIAPGDTPKMEAKDYLQIMVNDVIGITSTAESYIKQYYKVISEDNKQALLELETTERNIATHYNGLKTSYNKNKDKFDKIIEGKYALRNKQLKRLQELNPEIAGFFDIESTDAQEYTTWKEHLDVLKGKGNISKKERALLDSAYKKLEKGKKINNEELKFVMNAMKPMYGGHHITKDINDNPIVNRVVYIKSSSIPLLPQLTKGIKLDEVRKKLEQLQAKTGKNVRLSYQTANKIGAVNTKLTMNDLYNVAFANLYKEGFGLLSESSLILNRSGFRIQQENGYKTAKNLEANKEDHITGGSQMWKGLLAGGIANETKRIFPNSFDDALINAINVILKKEGEPLIVKYEKDENGKDVKVMLTGLELNKIKFHAEKMYFDAKRAELYDSLGLDIKTGTPKDKDKTIEKLAKILAKESLKYTDDITDGLVLVDGPNGKEFEVPLWLSANNGKFETILQSFIRKRVSEFTLPGYSHVLASSEGFVKTKIKSSKSLTAAQKVGIVWLDGNRTGELLATRTNAETGELEFSECLIQSKFRETKIVDGKEVTTLIDLTKEPYSKLNDEGVLVLDISMIDPELLKTFSFRIPTSGHQSGAMLKVVGFLPDAIGDTIIVPKEHTKQIGEDFDVDKRNVYKLNYKVDNVTGKIKLLEYSGEDQTFEDRIKMLENAMINTYSSVFSSPDNDIQKKISKILSMDNAKRAVKINDKKINENKPKDRFFTVFSDTYQRKLLTAAIDGSLGTAVHSNAVTFQGQLERLEQPLQMMRAIVYPDLVKIVQSDMYIGNIYSDGKLGNINTLGENGEKGEREIVDVNAENQNSSLDNIKAMIMALRNENKYTLSVFTQMVYRGFDAVSWESTDENNNSITIKNQVTSLFLSQPILRRYSQLMKEKESVYNKNISQEKVEIEVLTQLLKEYDVNRISEKKLDAQQLGDYDPSNFLSEAHYNKLSAEMTGKNLYENLIDNKNPLSANMQIAVLAKFFKLKQESASLSRYQQLTNSSGLGLSYFNVLDKIEVLNSMAEDQLFPGITALIGDFKSVDEAYFFPGEGYVKIGNNWIKPTTTEGTVLINSILSGQHIMDLAFPYKHPKIENVIAKTLGKTLDAIGIKRYKLLNNFKDFLYTSDVGFFNGDIQEERKRLFFDSKDNASLASILADLIKQRNPIMSNPFLSGLKPKVSLLDGEPSLIESFYNNDVSLEEGDKYDGFLELVGNTQILGYVTIMGVKTSITPQSLARDLATMAYLSKNESGVIGFKRFVNLEYLQELGITKIVRNKFNLDTITDTNIETFVRQYFQHNPDKATRFFKGDKIFPKNADDNYFNKLESFTPKLKVKKNGAVVIEPQYVTITTSIKGNNGFLLFEYNNGTYYRISTLGTPGFIEYNINTPYQNSLVNEKEFTPTPNPVSIENKSFNEKTNILNGIFDAMFENESENKNDEVLNIIKSIENNSNNSPVFLMNTIIEKSVNEKYNKLGAELLKHVDNDVSVKFFDSETSDIDDNIKSIKYGAYNNGVIYMNKDGLVELYKKNPGKFYQFLEEILMEEIIHSITIKELEKFGTMINGVYTANEEGRGKLFITSLIKLYETAKELLLYSETNKNGNIIAKNYYTKDLYEFVAGVFVSKEFRTKLDEAKPIGSNKSLLKRFKDALMSMLNSITGTTYSDKTINVVYDLLSGVDNSQVKIKEKTSISKAKVTSKPLTDVIKKEKKKSKEIFDNLKVSLDEVDEKYNVDVDVETKPKIETISKDYGVVTVKTNPSEEETQEINNQTQKVGFNIKELSPEKTSIDYKKAAIATDIIEFGRDTKNRKSTTKKYGEAAVSQGIPRNSSNYNNNTVAFVSTSGNNVATQEDINNTVNEILKVLNSGGSIIMDNKNNRNSKWNISGEGKVWELFTKQVDKTKLENISKDADFVQIKLNNQQTQAQEIYDKLGNVTVSENVKIKPVYQKAVIDYAKANNAIFSLRVNGSETHFGNPFSSVDAEIKKGLIATNSVKESVEKYIDWVINSADNRAKWIREMLNSGNLKNKDIIYYKELNEPSHATALDYLINNPNSPFNQTQETNGITNNEINNSAKNFESNENLTEDWQNVDNEDTCSPI